MGSDLHPALVDEILQLVGTGELGLTGACQRLGCSLQELAALLIERGVQPPYSVENYEADLRAVARYTRQR